MYPTYILRNTQTNRLHPIKFREVSLSQDTDYPEAVSGGLALYESMNHHLTGFTTIQEVKVWAQAEKGVKLLSERPIPWNGEHFHAKITMDLC